MRPQRRQERDRHHLRLCRGGPLGCRARAQDDGNRAQLRCSPARPELPRDHSSESRSQRHLCPYSRQHRPSGAGFAIRRDLLGGSRLGDEQPHRLLQRHLARRHGRRRFRRNSRLPDLRQPHALHPALRRGDPRCPPFHERAALGCAHQADRPAQGWPPRRRSGGSGDTLGNGCRLRHRLRGRRAPRRRRPRQEHRPAVLCRQGAGVEVPPAGQAAGHHHQRRRTRRHGSRPRRRSGDSAGAALGEHDAEAQRGHAAHLVAKQPGGHRGRRDAEALPRRHLGGGRG
ncbi:MAG: hypothetical protein AW12_01775 [Candidatus Accumulibacter sp. BA-94]|nr:MAG: hypothetical protein AW12_01775 [Candidatus Accumulibacter sp. BA-94]